MIRKKDKRKRKHNSNKTEGETASDNEKYLAYVTKKPKKKGSLSSIKSTSSSLDDLSAKSAKKKKKQNTLVDVASSASVSISAKPKINKAAIELNALISTVKKVNKASAQSKSKKKSATKIHKESRKNVIEIITPTENLEPIGSNIIHDLPSPSRLDEIRAEYSTMSVAKYPDMDMIPMIIEANLKRSTKYYTPEFLLEEPEDLKICKCNYTSLSSSESDDNSKKKTRSTISNKSPTVSSKKIKAKLLKKSKKKKAAAKSDADEKDTVESAADSNKQKHTAKSVIDSAKKKNITLVENSSKDKDNRESTANSNKLKDTAKSIANSSKQTDSTNSATDSSIEKNPVNSVSDANKKQNPDESVNYDNDVLKEFYEDVTRGFENLTNKSAKTVKKKKIALTVDESVTDSTSLMEIVEKNSTQLNRAPTISNMAQFFSLENKVILVLWPGTQFSFLGKLKLKVLYGAIELYGSILDPHSTEKSVDVYSPRGYSSISVSTFELDGSYDKEMLWDFLTSEGVDRSLKTTLHDVIKECKQGWSVILLENLENVLTNFLNNHCSFKLFHKVDDIKYSWSDPKRAECVLQAHFLFSRMKDEISICPQWNQPITKQLLDQWNSSKSLCTLIAGGKGVGKSTTARYLINNLLRHSKKVVLLDLDPGQAELTPAASVSLNIMDKPLLGPNFTHLKTPFCQLYLEDINVANCVNRYMECVKKLVECLKSEKDLLQYPIIINTMGFCKGIGLELCIFLIKLIEPTNVVQILSKRPKNNFDFALLKQTINERKISSICRDDDSVIMEKTCDYELHYVPSTAEGKRQFETWNMEPRQQRELVLLSYLSQIIENADDKSFCNITSNSINNVIPYTLPFSSFYVSLVKSTVSPTHILAAMNGNVVALCGIDLDNQITEEEKDALKYPQVVIKPPPSICYGYGIVRGIDMNRRCLYVNTPLKESALQHVNLLAGCSPMPFALLHSGERANAPYAGDRGELPTSREARRGYFRVDQTKTT